MNIRYSQDFLSGLFFCGVAIGGIALSSRLDLGTPARMAAGFFPMWLSVVLLLLGAVVLFRVELDVPQCGYCQSGMIMAAAHLLIRHPDPSDRDIDREMTNLCRCATYVRFARPSTWPPKSAAPRAAASRPESYRGLISARRSSRRPQMSP